MDNGHTGDTVLSWDDHHFVLVYDWRALGSLKTRFGTDFADKAGEVLAGAIGDLEALADILAIGLRRHHPDITAETLFDLSPPIAVAVAAATKAIARAFHGDREPRAEPARTRPQKPITTAPAT